MNIYVSNLGFNVEDEDLVDFFSPYGEVTSAKVIKDRETGKSRGFGFVEMPDGQAARKAIQELDQATVEGNTIKVSEARPKTERPGGSDGSFRNDRGFGNRKNRW
jgi:RNA-binding proteins (RRM domain)